jgi:excisionase family DNA binding protein
MEQQNLLEPLVAAIADAVVERLQERIAPRLMTVPEAARYLGRTERSLRHLISTHSVTVVREGRAVRLDRRELDRWIEKRVV